MAHTYKDWTGYSYGFTETGEIRLNYLLDEIADWVADTIRTTAADYVLNNTLEYLGKCVEIERIDIEASSEPGAMYTAIVTLKDGARWRVELDVITNDGDFGNFAVYEATMVSAAKEEE